MILILLIVVAVVAVVLLLANAQPDEFRVTRSAVINAPAAAVFEHVNDMHKWQAWSPWAKMDPYAAMSFDGPTAGQGASFRWNGKKTGEGNMTVTESRPSEFIRFRLEFLKPMKAVNTAEFTFAPEGNSTRVTWVMYGPNKFMGKCVGLFMNCEKMVGGQFTEGLENLRSIVENNPRKAA